MLSVMPGSLNVNSILGGFAKFGVLFGGPQNKDYNIGVYIGVPLFREKP